MESANEDAASTWRCDISQALVVSPNWICNGFKLGMFHFSNGLTHQKLLLENTGREPPKPFCPSEAKEQEGSWPRPASLALCFFLMFWVSFCLHLFLPPEKFKNVNVAECSQHNIFVGFCLASTNSNHGLWGGGHQFRVARPFSLQSGVNLKQRDNQLSNQSVTSSALEGMGGQQVEA